MNNKIKYILVVFIVLSLSINSFSAVNISDDSSEIPLQSSDSVDVSSDDNQAADNQNAGQNGNQAGDDQNKGQETNSGNGNTNTKPTFNFNGTGMGRNGTGSFDIADIISRLMNMTSNNTNDTTPSTNNTNNTADEVTDVPEVVTSTNYQPVSHPSVGETSQHIIKRARDSKIISQGDTLELEGINKLFDSNFTNGHLLVYIDGKLVFNEITTDDLSTPILGITNDLVGQHELSVEFTSNADSNSNTNKYTENIIIE